MRHKVKNLMHKLTNRVEKLETKNQFKKQWEASKQANKVKRI